MRVESRIPAILFKFFSFRSPYIDQMLESLLLRNEIFFPKPSQLNDPFDCRPVLTKDVPFSEFKSAFMRILDRFLMDDIDGFIKAGKIESNVRQLMKSVLAKRTDEYYRNMYDRGVETYMSERLLEEMGVLSFTETNTHELLWSHYGDSHRGFCVGFTGFALCDKRMLPAKVLYTAERPSFGYRDFLALLVQSKVQSGPLKAKSLPPMLRRYLLENIRVVDFFGKKSLAWQYEEEFRLAVFHGGGKYQCLHPIIASDIYLGTNSSEQDVAKIKGLLARRERPIRLHQARLLDEDFGISFGREEERGAQ